MVPSIGGDTIDLPWALPGNCILGQCIEHLVHLVRIQLLVDRHEIKLGALNLLLP